MSLSMNPNNGSRSPNSLRGNFSQSPMKESNKERLAVFIPDERNVWLSATCDASSLSDDNGNVEFIVDDDSLGGRTERRMMKVDIKTLPLHNISIGEAGVEDMCDLGFLHEASILDNLRRRFKMELPYTRSGEICIAVNPYKWLMHFYSKENMNEYRYKLRHELPPHVFATSAHAYRELRDNNRNQSILVSGESGAGKTETVKIMLNMLAHIATPKDTGGNSDTNTHTWNPTAACNPASTVVHRIVAANPLLESFGNAKTARNDNSSRFGKFTELQFDRNAAVLCGSKCTTYLLEKSRVVTQNDSHERNYHIFYQMLAHMKSREEGSVVPDRGDFNYLRNGDLKTTQIEGRTDLEGYVRTLGALSILGINTHLVQMMEDVLLGILYLGELDFHVDVQDNSQLSVKVDTDKAVSDFRTLAEKLGLDSQEAKLQFQSQLSTRSIHDDAVGSTINVPLSHEQACTAKDAIAKEVYARLFQWLVHVINFTTSTSTSTSTAAGNESTSSHSSFTGLTGKMRTESEDDDILSTGFARSSGSSSAEATVADFGTIALLDIFGFESFKVNRFEQLCINYANEKLQNKFCHDCFRTVQQEYRDEGLRWEDIPFNDNSETLQLLEGCGGDGSSNQTSLVALLNEECMLGARGSDTGYLNKAKAAFASKGKEVGHGSFSINIKSSDSGFVVHHYAGRVEYKVQQFVEKNRDTCPLEIHSVMANSANPLLSTLFGPNGMYFTGSSSHDLMSQHNRECIAQILLVHKDHIPELQDVHNGVVQSGSPVRAAPAMVPRLRASSSLRTRGTGTGEQARGRPRRTSFLSAETVTSKFKSQLSGLLQALHETQCQYVRCIKPNVRKSPTDYNLPMVVSQLRSAGMIEAVRISRAAFPYRITHVDFLARFKPLKSFRWHQELEQRKDIKEHAKALLVHALAEQPAEAMQDMGTPWEVGHTKLYFSAGVLEHLEALRSDLIHAHICKIQAKFRAFKFRTAFLHTRRCGVKIQSFWRCLMTSKLFQLKRTSAVKIQRLARMNSAIRLVQHVRVRYSVSRIMATFRMYKCYQNYHRGILPACATLQRLARGFVSRQRFRYMRQEAIRKANLQLQLDEMAEQKRDLAQEVERLTAVNQQLLSSVAAQDGDGHIYVHDPPPLPLPPVEALPTKVFSSQETQTEKEDLMVLLKNVVTAAKQQGKDWLHLLSAVAPAAALPAGFSTPLSQPSLQTSKPAEKDSSTTISPPARVRKSDVKDVLRLMESGDGLSCTIYAVQRRGGALVGKPALIKRKHDLSVLGEYRIDCEVRNPSTTSNGFTGVIGSAPALAKAEDSSSHTTGAPSVRVLRFSVADIVQVRRGRCGLIQLPDTVIDNTCLILTVRNKGELNFVLESKHRCEVAYVAFHYLLQRCKTTPDSTPSPTVSVSRSPTRALTTANVASISRHLSPVRSRGFRSPLVDHVQRQARTALTGGISQSPKHRTVRVHEDKASDELPSPPALPYGTVLTSPMRTASSGTSTSTLDKENTRRSRSDVNSDRGLSPIAMRTQKDAFDSSLKTDLAVQKALYDADTVLEKAGVCSPTPSTVKLMKKGWVSKDNGVTGLNTSHFTRRFLMLERETRLLKFSNSELAEYYPSQVRGMLALHPSCTLIKVTKAAQSGSISSYFSSNASNILEISSTAPGKESSIRLQFETIAELSSWQRAIEDVMVGVR